MTARRQSSTTSLSKYARVNSPDLSNRSLDFCNAFWGPGDGGVDVLFARMRGGLRTVEELKAFWKERASIEEDYAKRMSKLAKQALGRDEIGELRNSLDTLRLETDRQAISHQNLAQQLRTELENPIAAFSTRQTHFKRVAQGLIEKAYKNKQAQEQHVARAREKYESDCMRINSYTAQSTLVQGKDLEKIQAKLDRARQTVTANERDFANFARELQRTVEKWERDWKSFCDGCQDLEEERIEFMKDNVWAYANAVSTVCVSDDESCEHIRVALEQLEPERDMENFVRDYGTGSEIPDPPKFINYTNPEATQTSQSRQIPRYAQFPRTSQRQMSMAQVMRTQVPEEEPADAGMAGFGAGGVVNGVSRDGEQSRPSSTAPVNGVNGDSVYAASPTSVAGSQVQQGIVGPPTGQSAPAPALKSMLKVGDNAYEVDPDKDPQEQTRTGPGYISPVSMGRPGSVPSTAGSKVGAEDDPLKRQMTQLVNSAATGPTRRTSTNVTRPGHVSPAPITTAVGRSPGPSGSAGGNSLNAPPPASPLHQTAESVVGSYPPSASRPTSPAVSPSGQAPPVAAFMQPPQSKPTSPLPVEEVLASYSPALPGERKAPISRSNSPGVGPSHSHSQSLGSNIAQAAANRASLIERPRSREGFAGIGSGGRTPSPQPNPPPMNNPSRMSFTGPPPTMGGPGRMASPSKNLGISLDESGRVAHDAMAEQYTRQPQQPPQVQPPVQQPSHMHQQSYGGPQRSQSVSMAPPVGPPPAIGQSSYGGPPPGPYPGQPQQQPPYAQTPAPAPDPQRQQSVWYNPHAPPPQQPPPPPQQYAPPPAQISYAPPPQQQPAYAQPANGTLSRGPSANAYYNPNMNGGPNVGHGFRAPSPQPQQVRRSPSPIPPPAAGAPTGQYIDGRPVLFYVKALYDYQATIEEEFDFQSGDVIAVTSTPEDGWWTGVLLDDSRRIPGRTIFPSNFVCLF